MEFFQSPERISIIVFVHLAHEHGNTMDFAGYVEDPQERAVEKLWKGFENDSVVRRKGTQTAYEAGVHVMCFLGLDCSMQLLKIGRDGPSQ